MNPTNSRYQLSQGPYNYEKRTAVPEASFNDFVRGGLRRLYLQKFGPSRNYRW